MNTEQELRPCPFCGGPAHIDTIGKGGSRGVAVFCNNNQCPGVAHGSGAGIENMRRSAIAAWNRRSSDEQAEVVGWQVREKSTQWDDCEWTEWRQASDDFAQRLIRDGGKVDDFRIAEVRPVYASPPAVTEVTEEMVEAAARAIKPNIFGANYTGRVTDIARAALTAAIAIGDEGIREGWQTIDTAPTAMHVMACRFDHDVGEWVYDVVLSPPSYPFTHWRLLDPPPSRGEGV